MTSLKWKINAIHRKSIVSAITYLNFGKNGQQNNTDIRAYEFQKIPYID